MEPFVLCKGDDVKEGNSSDLDPIRPDDRGCKKGIWKWACATLLLLGISWWVWTWLREDESSEELAKQAVEAYETGHYDLAIATQRKLEENYPNQPETLRATGRVLRSIDPFRAFLSMRRLKLMEKADSDDLRLFARLAQDVRKTHLAETVTKKLLEEEPANPDNLFLAARKSFLDFRGMEAFEQTVAILQENPTHRPTRLLQARLLTLRPELLHRLQGKTELKVLVEEKQDRVSLEALIVLAFSDLKPLEATERKATLRQIRNHPLASDSLKLKAFGQLHGSHRISDETLESLRKKHGKEPELLGAWLAQRGRLKEANSLFSMKQVEERPELIHDWLGVLMNRSPINRDDRLKEAKSILNEAEGMVPEEDRLLLKAILHREEGNPASMRKQFELAFAEASSLSMEDREEFLDRLAKLSLVSNELEIATRVLQERFSNGIGENVPYEACERYFIVSVLNKEVSEALAIAKQVEQRYPAQFAARNNLAYLKLLTKSDVEKTASEVEKLAVEGPAIPSFRTTLALARLRSGKPREALQAIMLKDQLPAIYQGDGDKAVCAATLWANGKKERALELANLIRRENLLPQETALLNPIK